MPIYALRPAEKQARQLAERLRPTALAEFDAALSAVFAAGADARRRAREAGGLALRDAFTRLQLLSHGIEVTFPPSCTSCLHQLLPVLHCTEISKAVGSRSGAARRLQSSAAAVTLHRGHTSCPFEITFGKAHTES